MYLVALTKDEQTNPYKCSFKDAILNQEWHWQQMYKAARKNLIINTVRFYYRDNQF